MRTVTKCKIASAARPDIAPDVLAELSETHIKGSAK
jgi:hypothetical protein